MEIKDIIGKLNFSSGTTYYSIEFIFISLLIVGVVIYIVFKPKKNSVPEEGIVSAPKDQIKNPTSKFKEEKRLEKKEEENLTKIAKLKTKTLPSTLKVENKKPAIEVDKETRPDVNEIQTTVKENKIIVPDTEEQSKEKYIGYNPINVFVQTEPLYFPYVMMPKPNSIIKFPRKGRIGRKGFKEEAFKAYLKKYFNSNYKVFDDRFILIKNSTRPFEPDFALIYERNGINIFLDIEIDEPYEGTNDIENRKPTHYKYSDTNRNYAFTNRGWIVIRFAEIQVHQQPDACCQFIAHILKSIHSEYTIPASLQTVEKIKPLLQWTEEEAKQWSLKKYRESYLGIARFGVTTNINSLQDVEETELGVAIEQHVAEDEIINEISLEKKVDNLTKINLAVYSRKYLSFSIDNEKIIVAPTSINDNELTGFCYVKNDVRSYPIIKMENIEIKDKYYTLQISGHHITVEQISNILNTAIDYKKYVRMKYTRAGWRNVYVDIETGELIEEKITSEESIRTISDVQLSINVLDQEHIQNYRLNSNYLTAYCHKREEQRTFKFDRISEIEILDI